MFKNLHRILLIIIICLSAESGFAFDRFLPDNSLNFLIKDKLDYIRPPIIYSGKNKVSWKRLRWKKLRLEASDIYYYERINPIVPLTMDVVEKQDIMLQDFFNYDIHKYYKQAKKKALLEDSDDPPTEAKLLKKDRKIPVMVYGSHQVFEQTNTIFGFIPEGTGGFTEFLKGRVVLPYSGDNKAFVHVIRHELVHAHNLQKIYQMWKDYDLSGWNSRPPLWVLEGVAEWGSRCKYLYNEDTEKYELDDETKMYLRDATVNNLIPHMAMLDSRPGYLYTYKLSQSAINFICNKYGVDELLSMYDNWYRIEGKKKKESAEFWKNNKGQRTDLLNPGVSMYDEPFVIIGGKVYDLFKDSDTYSIIVEDEKLTHINDIPVNAFVDNAENLELDDEWFMIYYDARKHKYLLYNMEKEWLTKWKKKNVNKLIRKKKKDLLRTNYRLDFNGLIKYCLGDSLNDINKAWQNYNKETYYPAYSLKEKLNTMDKLTKGIYDRFPVVSKDGRFLLYKSYNKQYYFNLNIMDTKSKKTARLAHDNTVDIESIHVLNAGNDIIETEENNYSVIFSAQRENSDVVYQIDFELIDDRKIKVAKKIELFDFDDYDIIDISMLKFSHDGKHVVFRGVVDSGQADLYSVELETGEFTRITDDYYDESSPDMMDDTIVFTSDRGSDYLEFNNDIFKLYLNERNEDGSYRIEQLTDGKEEYASTCFTEEGNILFSSFRDGYSNIYMIDTEDQILRLTDIYTGAFNPVMRNEKLTFCGYNKGRYNIYQVDYSSLNVVNTGTVEKKPWNKNESWEIKRTIEKKPENYKKKFSLDYVGGGFIFSDIEFSANFSGQIYLSDMLGNDVFGIGLLQPGENIADMNFVFSYTNLSKRFKKSFGVFRLMSYYYLGDDLSSGLLTDDVGGFFTRAFPLNKSQSISTSLIMKKASRYADYVDLVGRNLYEPTQFLATLSNSFIHDSTTWSHASPVEGTLFGILIDSTFDVSDNGKLLNTVVMSDLRKYFRLSPNSCIAMRLGTGQSWGNEPHYFAMGSGLYMRGYEGAHDFKGTKYIMMNLELRGRIIDVVKILVHNHPEAPVMLGPFQGAIFCDFGYAWSDVDPMTPSGSMGLSFRFFPVYAPIYLSYDIGVTEFWPGGSRRNLNSYLRIRFSF